jgi:hypothetical protein
VSARDFDEPNAFINGTGFVSPTLADAKGDLIVATADDTLARLAVGTNGHVVTADSGETGGMKWAQPGATPTQNAQTGTTYTAVLLDAGKTVTLSNASAVTLTIPAQASVSWADNTQLNFLNIGAGTVTITAAADVTINGTPLTLATSKGGSLVRTASNTWTFTPTGGGGSANGLFNKSDAGSVAFTKTGVGTVSVKAGTSVEVLGSLITFATDTAVTMPSLTAGTDYYIYVTTAGVISAVAATGTWPTPVASPPASSRLIGGFHYSPGGNAAARAGGNTTAQVNEFSLWDLKWKPAALDPRGMTLVNTHFWSDIYLLNTSHATVGTSSNDQTIYDTNTWWNSVEVLGLYGKRPPRYREFADLAFGTTEAVSRGNDPVTTGIATTNAGSSQADQVFTSKFGVIQSSGCLFVWGDEFGGGTGTAAYTANTGGRGSTYLLENAALFGGAWYEAATSGSRSSAWLHSPTLTSNGVGARGVCDHLTLV